MATLELEDISKVYGDDTVAVDHLDLDIADGEFVVLVGPSGCGKTTALRMIAGLETITEGEIRIGDRVVNHIPPRDRDIAMVFQNYALYPHLTVGENLGFSLKLRKVKRDEIKSRVDKAARILGLEGLLDRKPRQLSGGQRQRVAMGRAIVREPQAFLMDEPLSNLDAKLRVQMRAEVARIQRDLGTTTVYVTHDQTEAMTMGDRVAVMKRGVLQQIASPQELYDRPVNVFVGGFIGSPAMNLVEAKVVEADGVWFTEFGEHRLRIPDALVDGAPALRSTAGRPLVLGIRPEHFEDAAIVGDVPDDRRIRAQVELVEHLGAEAYLHLSLGAPTVLTDDTRELARDLETGGSTGDAEELAESAPGVARVDPSTRARKGEPIELAVDVDHLYFFDLESGNAIQRMGDAT